MSTLEIHCWRGSNVIVETKLPYPLLDVTLAFCLHLQFALLCINLQRKARHPECLTIAVDVWCSPTEMHPFTNALFRKVVKPEHCSLTIFQRKRKTLLLLCSSLPSLCLAIWEWGRRGIKGSSSYYRSPPPWLTYMVPWNAIAVAEPRLLKGLSGLRQEAVMVLKRQVTYLSCFVLPGWELFLFC